MSQTTTTSGMFSLKARDFLKGLVIAVVSPVFTIMITSLNAGTLTFDWKTIAIVSISATLTYLSKNLFSPAQIVITDPSPSSVDAVNKEGAQARVIS